MKPKIIVSDLDMSQAKIPTTWDCSWCKSAIVTEWEYVVETNRNWYSDYTTDPYSSNSLRDIRVYHWIDEIHGYVFELAIIDYKYPLVAQIHFYLNDPKDIYRKTFWNFSYAPENIVPKDWDWENNEADEYLVRCGIGTEERCFDWFYQARYGQYYLLIHFYQDLNYKNFEEIVKAINREFILNLK
jgi:hypothetical protein